MSALSRTVLLASNLKRENVFFNTKINVWNLNILHFVFQINVVYDLQHIYILHSIQSSLEMNVHKSLPPITVKTDLLNHMVLLYF